MNPALPCDLDLIDLIDIVQGELERRTTPESLAAYLDDRRTKRAIDLIHQHGTLAARAMVEDLIASAHARTTQEVIPCPL